MQTLVRDTGIELAQSICFGGGWSPPQQGSLPGVSGIGPAARGLGKTIGAGPINYSARTRPVLFPNKYFSLVIA
jgi:hypothetical protein